MSFHFIVESGWYLDYDNNGHTTAYRVDVGPQRGYALYKASKSKDTNHGTEAWLDAIVAEIQEENPNFPISCDMMNEMRTECGLPLEE